MLILPSRAECWQALSKTDMMMPLVPLDPEASDMHFRERLHRGDQLIGTLITLGSPPVAEILSHLEYDWLFIDLEHSAMGPSEAQAVLQAIGNRKPTLLRVESRDETGILKALDLGATGIIVPRVNSRADAERAVAFAKYPPAGRRSVGLGRAANYGNCFAEYIKRANDETTVVIQIEHIDALANIEDIASVEGIDALFVGPYDLSGSMGKLGAVESPEVMEAVASILEVGQRRKLAVGIFAGTGVLARQYLQQGFSLVAVATDGMLLGRAAAAELKMIAQ